MTNYLFHLEISLYMIRTLKVLQFKMLALDEILPIRVTALFNVSLPCYLIDIQRATSNTE